MDFSMNQISPSKSQSEPLHTKVLILGTGPAGLSAGLMLPGRFSPIILAGMKWAVRFP